MTLTPSFTKTNGVYIKNYNELHLITAFFCALWETLDNINCRPSLLLSLFQRMPQTLSGLKNVWCVCNKLSVKVQRCSLISWFFFLFMYTGWWLHTVWAHNHNQAVCRARKDLAWGMKERQTVNEYELASKLLRKKIPCNSEEHSRCTHGEWNVHIFQLWISVSQQRIKVLSGALGFGFNQFSLVVLWYFVWKWSDVIEIQNHFTHIKTWYCP